MTEIRQARASDAAALHALAATTFELACPPGTTRIDMDEHIATHLSERRFGEFLASDAHEIRVVDSGRGLLGYTMLVHGFEGDAEVAAALTVRPTTELSKCYLLPDRHGSGLASDLMEATVAAAGARGAAAVWLGVNQLNPRANRFYEKHGFVVVGTKHFVVGAETHEDFTRERVL